MEVKMEYYQSCLMMDYQHLIFCLFILNSFYFYSCDKTWLLFGEKRCHYSWGLYPNYENNREQ